MKVKKQYAHNCVLRDALREAIREEMQRDERVYILGEDIAGYARHLPRSPRGYLRNSVKSGSRILHWLKMVIAGAAIGSVARPIAELMTANFSLLASDLDH